MRVRYVEVQYVNVRHVECSLHENSLYEGSLWKGSLSRCLLCKGVNLYIQNYDVICVSVSIMGVHLSVCLRYKAIICPTSATGKHRRRPLIPIIFFIKADESEIFFAISVIIYQGKWILKTDDWKLITPTRFDYFLISISGTPGPSLKTPYVYRCCSHT